MIKRHDRILLPSLFSDTMKAAARRIYGKMRRDEEMRHAPVCQAGHVTPKSSTATATTAATAAAATANMRAVMEPKFHQRSSIPLSSASFAIPPTHQPSLPDLSLYALPRTILPECC